MKATPMQSVSTVIAAELLVADAFQSKSYAVVFRPPAMEGYGGRAFLKEVGHLNSRVWAFNTIAALVWVTAGAYSLF